MQISAINKHYVKRKSNALTLLWHQFDHLSARNNKDMTDFIVAGAFINGCHGNRKNGLKSQKKKSNPHTFSLQYIILVISTLRSLLTGYGSGSLFSYKRASTNTKIKTKVLILFRVQAVSSYKMSMSWRQLKTLFAHKCSDVSEMLYPYIIWPTSRYFDPSGVFGIFRKVKFIAA